jgi:hypothetical protein
LSSFGVLFAIFRRETVDADRSLKRDQAFLNVLPYAFTVPVLRIAVASAATMLGKNAFTFLKDDLRNRRKILYETVSLHVTNPGAASFEAPLHSLWRRQVAVSSVGDGHFPAAWSVGQEASGSAAIRAGALRIACEPLLIHIERILLLIDFDAVSVLKAVHDWEYIIDPAIGR